MNESILKVKPNGADLSKCIKKEGYLVFPPPSFLLSFLSCIIFIIIRSIIKRAKSEKPAAKSNRTRDFFFLYFGVAFAFTPSSYFVNSLAFDLLSRLPAPVSPSQPYPSVLLQDYGWGLLILWSSLWAVSLSITLRAE